MTNDKSRRCWRRANRAKTIEAIDKPRAAISHEFVMARYANATRDEIEERMKRMRALKTMWNGRDIPIDVLKDFD